MRGKRGKDTVAEQSPKGERSYNGPAEQGNKEVEGTIRTLKRSMAERTGKLLNGHAVFMQWLLAHVGASLTRMKVGAVALTPCERLKGKSLT